MIWKKTAWDPLTTAAVKRVPTYVLKLAMVYAALEQTVPVITKPQVEAAIEVGDYGATCAERLMQRDRQQTMQGQCEQAVLKVLERQSHPAWKIHRKIGGRFTAEAVARALKALVTTGAIEEVGKTKRNEPIYRRRDREV
jgi:hypothetical protein